MNALSISRSNERSSAPGPRPGSAVVHPLADALLHLRRDDRVRWLAEVEAGFASLPEAPVYTSGLRRRLALEDAANRLVFRLHGRAPRTAARLARCVPVVDPTRTLATLPAGRPAIFALTHFGPIHYVFTVLARRVPGRTLLAVHAGGERAAEAAAYLRAIGVAPLVSDERALRSAAREMTRNPSSAIALSYDYLGGRARGSVPFFGGSVGAARGLAFLADATDAVVIPARGIWSPRGLRVEVDAAVEIDRTLDPVERRAALTRALFASLERRVRAAPASWTEWANCRALT